MGNIIGRLKQPFKDQSGVTLIEVMIAVAIFAIGITSVAVLNYKTIGGNTRGRMITEATTLAERQMETLMETPYSSITSGSDASVLPYTVTWTLADIDLDGDGTNDSKRIDLTVTAPQMQGNRAISMIFFKDNLT